MQIERIGSSGELVEYRRGWDLQREVHADVVAGRRESAVLLLEHTSTYTAGRLTQAGDRPTDGTPVVDVDRGGRITWHGPGQLVGYPVLALPRPVDVVAHVRRIEAVLIAVCADLGVDAMRVEGRSGVWVAGSPDAKVAAIGVRVARGVTMHGFALNADCDLAGFGAIVPCGIADAAVTSLSVELGRRVRVAEVEPLVRAHLHLLSPAPAAAALAATSR